MPDRRDPDAIADEVLPLDGPHTADACRDAADLIAALVRRLNHATLNQPFTYPAHLDAVVGRLATATAGMPQLLGQLAGLLRQFENAAGLYADRDAKGATPEQVIAGALGRLGLAASYVAGVADQMTAARNLTARLGIHTDEQE